MGEAHDREGLDRVAALVEGAQEEAAVVADEAAQRSAEGETIIGELRHHPYISERLARHHDEQMLSRGIAIELQPAQALVCFHR